EAIHDYLHPRKIESSVAPVAVEEIWSKSDDGLPKLLSVFVHVLVVSLALVPWATSFPKTPKLTETAVMVYRPINLVLPVADNDKSGGGGGGVFRVGGGVTPPTVLQRVEPQYSEEARKARYQGTVVLEAIVRKDGTVDIMRIVRSLGFGLDENAIQALKQWRFRPGMRN